MHIYYIYIYATEPLLVCPVNMLLLIDTSLNCLIPYYIILIHLINIPL